MSLIEATLAGIAGVTLGGVVNVISYRLPRHKKLFDLPFRCTTCDTSVRLYDCIPLISWLLLRGKCRTCHSAVPVRYPIIELVTAGLVIAVLITKSLTGAGLLGVVFVVVLMAATAIDLEYRIIPNKLNFAGAIMVLVVLGLTDISALPGHLLAGVLAGLFFLIPALFFPSGMGMGDVKLVAVMGLFLGRAIVPAVFFAILAGGLISIVILMRSGVKEGRKQGIPFGPYLAFGGIVGLLFGNELLNAYLGQ
jgi:leader peptidase (prepilin peptidase) / N-methyltransferase